MALTVNSNIPSVNAQRNLQKSTQALTKSLERLSSGLRINRAGDDAAGLAISENIRSQVRGLDMAVRNASDGISLVNTAEGAIQEVSNILQRMRVLAIQAGNDTNSASNRASLQLEVDQLIEELARISDTVQFNGRNLLDGTFQGMKLQVGAQAYQTIEIDINDMRGETLGAAATATSASPTAALVSNDLLFNGVDIGATSDDGVSYLGGTYSALAMVNAINAKTGQTNVMAQIVGTTVTANAGGNDVDAVNIDGTTNTFEINGVAIPATNVQDNDADGALVNAINSISNMTGVTASLNASNQLVLNAEDGRNIVLTTTGSIADELGFLAVDGDLTNNITTGTYKIISDEIISITGNNVARSGLSAGTVSIAYDTAVNNIDITTHEGANEAIISLDYALRQINNNRAALGAITNRLEMTISNLQTISENLSASDSRIRDADFAYETAQLTRNQILQQAGVAILAQANVTPQTALQLLQQ